MITLKQILHYIEIQTSPKDIFAIRIISESTKILAAEEKKVVFTAITLSQKLLKKNTHIF